MIALWNSTALVSLGDNIILNEEFRLMPLENIRFACKSHLFDGLDL